jgi:hypothetical protein
MRRLVSSLLPLCLVIPLFIGCGGADTEPKEPESFAPPPGAASGGTAKEQKEAAKSKVGDPGEPVS